MRPTSKLKFPKEGELDDFSYVYGVEMTLIDSITAAYEWIGLDLLVENQGNVRILENIINSLELRRNELRREYPMWFEERD